MKKQIFLGAALLLLTASCSNNDTTNEDEKGKVNVAQAVNFTVDFADYNAEQEVGVTRAAEANKEEKLEQQAIDLGNGILAMCTLQRDNTKQEKPAATRALPNDTYTMMAYDAATHAFKGEMTGTVSGGAFTPADAQKRILLEPGTYDFVLFNSKVSRSGNNLTVNRSDAATAMIGRTQQTINSTPKQQQVAFTMKHAGAKVKIQVIGYMDFSGVTATLESVNATDIPGSSVYDAVTGTWTAGGGVALSANTTYGGSSNIGTRYVVNSNEEIAFMPATDVSKLKLTFNSGSIYLQNMANKSLTFSPATPLTLEQNGAYVLNVKLMYNFLYLMSDGSTGLFDKTTYGGGTKTPIGIVVSRSRHLAIALQDANSGSIYQWTTNNNFFWPQVNTNMKKNFNEMLALENGYDETWDANCTTAIVTGEKVKGKRADFPAFKAAADYGPMLPVGVNLTNGMENRKWHLPAFGEWKYVFTELGFLNMAQVTNWNNDYNWYGHLANVAFTQVGGTGIGRSVWYWTSSEYNNYNAGYVDITPLDISFGYSYLKKDRIFVRAFIKYKD